MRPVHLRWFAWTTLLFVIAVILWGAVVRATGAGAGCGAHWPTCDGQIVPRPRTVAMAIEFTHRLTSGVSGLLVLVEFLWVMAMVPKGHPARRTSVAAGLLMLSEGAVGAALVLFEYVATDRSVARAVWMSVHLVNTLLLLAALSLTAFFLSEGGGPPSKLSRATWGRLLAPGYLGVLLVGTSGAITALGDTLFTATSLSQGIASDLSPAAHFLQQLRVIHPGAAVLVTAYLFHVRAKLGKEDGAVIIRFRRALGFLLLVQTAAGFVNLALLAPLWMQIVHLLIADLLWVVLVLIGATMMGRHASQEFVVQQPRRV